MKRGVHKGLRKFALYLKARTDKWVVPLNIIEMVDREEFGKALVELDKQELLWPNDPEIAYYRAMINFLKGD